MRIAVCKSNKHYLNTLKLMIYRYAEKMKIEILTECYLCGKDMLASGNRFNIVFLDYNLAGEKGLQIAKAIRKFDSLCLIVFIGSDTCFAGDIVKVYPSDYLTYPINEAKVFGVLDEYFCKRGIKYPLLIKSGEDIVCLNTSEIVYLEASNKHCVVHLKEKSLNCNKTMACVYDQLPKILFLKINRAFVINSGYINRFNKGHLR